MLKQLKDNEKKLYINTRKALQYLYEENLRESNNDMAFLLLETINCCDKILKSEPITDDKLADAMHILDFIKDFLKLDVISRKQFINHLSNAENYH